MRSEGFPKSILEGFAKYLFFWNTRCFKYIENTEVIKMRTAKEIKIPEINEDLAYLCGVLAGDGNILIRKFKNEYRVNCGGNPRDEVEFYDKTIVPLFERLFHLHVKSRLMGKTYGVNIYSKSLVLFLTEICGLPNGRKDNLRIPPIFKDNQLLVRSFIRGVADTDFTIKLSNNYPVIGGCNKTTPFMAEIAVALEKDGFKVAKLFNYKVNDQRLRKGYNVINWIYLNGHKQFAKWVDLIGTCHPKQLKKMELWRMSMRNKTSEGRI